MRAKQNSKRVRAALMLVCAAWMLAGCSRQSPVALVDEDIPSQDLELLYPAVPPGSPYSSGTLDTTEVSPVTVRLPGQLIVSGSRFDSPFAHREGFVARGIFFSRSSPIVLNGDTFYHSIDIGNLFLDELQLERAAAVVDRVLSHDTLGVQYVLDSRTTHGTGDLRYAGSHRYSWRGEGSAAAPFVSAFTISVDSPPEIRVTAPTPAAAISLSQNLRVRWEGGAPSIRIFISIMRPGMEPRPLLHMRVRVNRGGIVIPATILALLPAGIPRFLFSFVSDSAAITSVPGFPGNVLVQSSYSHNLLLPVRP